MVEHKPPEPRPEYTCDVTVDCRTGNHIACTGEDAAYCWCSCHDDRADE
jgi:hypothetical protein